jgi:N6-adenosine-specific RNA methylase IME4/ParB-like chromosome segregation protein Spo0J
MAITAIRIGSRHRRDMGDIIGLARSIEADGLLHPIVIRSDGKLIAGERRIAAYKHLGRTEIPVTIVDLEQVVRGEFAENVFRKAFTPSEMVSIAQALEPIERAKAKERQGKHPEKFSEPAGNALDKIATFAGTSRPTLTKARAVVEAAEAEPERFSGLVQYMDDSGRVDRAYKQLQIERAKEHHRSIIAHGCIVGDLVALAESGKRFGVIYGDPPWPWETWGGDSGKIRSAPDNHYGTSALDEIAHLPVAPLAADDCALLMWCTAPHITIGTHIAVIDQWGFRPCTFAFDWVKTTADGGLHTGMGYYTRSNSEICLLAIKGSPMRLATEVHEIVMAPVGEHSAKPEEVRRRIERLFPGPYLELYGRKQVPGWTVWGNEIPRASFGEAAE